MYVILSLIALVASLLVAYLRNVYSYWEKRGVPFEPPTLLLGNMKGVGRSTSLRQLDRRIYKQFKGKAPFAGFYLFMARSAFILDLDLMKSILIKDFNNFHDRGVFNNVEDDPLTGHLFTLEGEQWRAMRQKLTPTFTSGKMKMMFPIVRGVSENLTQTCDDLVRADPDGVVEVKELCARYTTDVIGTCAFGLECNSLKDPSAEFRIKGRMILEKPRHSPLVLLFVILNPKWSRKLHMKFIPDELSEFFFNVVRETVDYRVKNNVKRNDFMDLLIELMAKDQEAARQGSGIDLSQGLTIEQMAAQAFVFFVAGFDTSSSTMAFALYELALQPEVQEKLRMEIMAVISAHNGEITYEGINEMQYLDQVISETLRKYAVVPHLIRKAINDYKVPNSHHIIEAGTGIIIPIDAVHYDPEIYPEPEKFNPSRFNPEEVKKRHPCAYMPFGDGSRQCIGMRFGLMQAKIGLVKFLQNYKFSVSQRTEVPLTFEEKIFFTTAKNGISLRVDKI